MIALLAPIVFAQHLQEFVFRADKSYRSVNLVGTFNGWNKGATPMKVDPDGRTWKVNIAIEPGEIQYKFVLDDEVWITDPAGKSVDDGEGHQNSILVILPEGYDIPARAGDGTITLSALRHLQQAPDLNLDRGKLTLAFRARPNDVGRISVLVNGKSIPMVGRQQSSLYSRYEAAVPWSGSGNLRYVFALEDGSGTKFYGPSGLSDKETGNDFVLDGRTYHPASPPAWMEKTVIYQIFPDRFANGDRTNDPPDVAPWDSKPKGSSFFGGDVAGIRQHLDYLSSLGIKAIYFNPIFKSPVSHRYETSDYLQIDARFGTNQEFCDLTRAMKAKGIGTILDGVFNHSATNLFAFADILSKQKDSKYLDWYTVKSFPVTVKENPPYVAWWNYPSLPKINVLNPDTTAYLLGATEYWHRHAAISGWRLDAANEVPMEFWRKFRTTVKTLDPNAWIVGEEWGDASAWLKGDQWDASMNYPFREVILKFLSTSGNGNSADLLFGLMRVYNMYAPQVSRNQMNIIGSHDTPRILTLCGGDERLALLAATIQMTWVGVPSIYYGDEIGMAGGADPDDRRGMEWNRATGSNEFLARYRKLVAIRQANPQLQSGDPVPLSASGDQGTAAYARVLDGRLAVVAVNRSDQSKTVDISLASQMSQVKPNQSFTDALSGIAVRVGKDGFLRVPVPSKGAVILLPHPGAFIPHSPEF